MVLGLLGLVASCILLVTHVHWNMRALQWGLRRQWFQHWGHLSDTIVVSQNAAATVIW